MTFFQRVTSRWGITTLLVVVFLVAALAIYLSRKQGERLASQTGERGEIAVHASPFPSDKDTTETNSAIRQATGASKSTSAPDIQISRAKISEVNTRQEAVKLHRIITLRFLDQLEKFSSTTTSQVRMRQELEDTADRYYLLERVCKIHGLDPLGAESLTESDRLRVEKIVETLGYSTPAARAADAAFAKFDLLRDEHIVHTLRKWLDATGR